MSFCEPFKALLGRPVVQYVAGHAGEAQQVIGLRLARLAGGGHSAWVEATRMTSEKIAALGEAQTAATVALLTGKATAVPSRTVAFYRRKMRANRKRLSAQRLRS